MAWGVTKYKSKPCLCGCGEFVKLHIYPRKKGGGNSYLVCDFIRGHSSRGTEGFNPEIHAPRKCVCGCGGWTMFGEGRYNRFVKGHENIGRSPWNKGRPFTEESRRKMSLARLGKEPANKAQIDLRKLYYLYVSKRQNALSVSKELAVSVDAVKNRLRKLGWSRASRESCSSPSFKELMRRIRIQVLTSHKKVATPNRLEQAVYGTLDKLQVPYQKQVSLFNKFVVDVFFPQEQLVLEIFGRYWHELPVNKKKDFSKKRYLEKCGYKLEVLWDDQIKKSGLEYLLRGIFRKYNLV